MIGGVNSAGISPEPWRQQIGYVSQDSIIFDDTIENNIRMSGYLGRELPGTAEDVNEALKAVGLLEYVENLPDKLDTVVGERGLRLSGGQRQRLFIAREIFRRPALLILDEATSALDAETEMEVQTSIDNLHGTLTTVIIAHRLSTIRSVDSIVVLDKGAVVELDPIRN